MMDTMHYRVCALRQRNGAASAVLAFVTLLMSVVVTGQSAQGQTLTVLYAFAGGADGANPRTGLILDVAGNLYGTTAAGGAFGLGTVFKLDTTGNESVLHSFAGGADGANPSGLIRDGAGTLYGTTVAGGAFGLGTVFKLDTTGKESVLHSFAGGADGANPSGLIRDGAGTLYGTTAAGGAFGGGTVFKLDTTGNESVLHSFAFGRIPVIDGSLVAGLVLDSKGNLYGTTTGLFSQCFFRSDFFACGTVYKLDAAGNYSVLVRFNLRDGAIPEARLILDAAGNLYGTTVYGGASYPPIRGTVFKVGATGGFTLLHSFTGTDGANPYAGLIRDVAGSLYGTTANGGSFGLGTVFKVNASGQESVLHSFTGGADGANPRTGLMLDVAGNLYGTSSSGGFGFGTVFELTP